MLESTLPIDTTRKALGWHACVESIDLAGVLQRELEREDSAGCIRMVGPSLLRRIEELQHVVLDLLDANELGADEMRRIIHGARAGA